MAQQREFYTSEDESKLNELVERPGNAVIDKRLCGESLTDEDRARLSIYIATMIQRVPARRERNKQALPDILAKTMTDLREKILELGRTTDIDPSVIEARLAEADNFEEKYKHDTPDEVVETIRSPWPNFAALNLISSMKWFWVRAKGPSFFVTSDNPAFFFKCYGLGSQESEFTFPISTELALFGTWKNAIYSDTPICDQNFVKEANRRIISATSRFVFYHKKAHWIRTVASKPSPYLSRII